MCGRAYQTYTNAELACLDDHGKSPELDWLAPNCNLAPTETSPVVLVRDDTRVFEPFWWGLVPSWAKSVQATSYVEVCSDQRQRRRDHREAYLR